MKKTTDTYLPGSLPEHIRQRKKALEALEKAKTQERNLLKSGYTWIEVDARTRQFVPKKQKP